MIEMLVRDVGLIVIAFAFLFGIVLSILMLTNDVKHSLDKTLVWRELSIVGIVGWAVFINLRSDDPDERPLWLLLAWLGLWLNFGASMAGVLWAIHRERWGILTSGNGGNGKSNARNAARH